MKRKRKNIILWCFVAIALILGTALLCFLLWRYVFPLGAESPESQLNRYYSCIMTGDYAEMYEMLTMDSGWTLLPGKSPFRIRLFSNLTERSGNIRWRGMIP